MHDSRDAAPSPATPAPLAPTRRVAAVIVAVLFAAVFAVRWLTDDVADATSLLYVLPIALSAAVFGRRAGVIAAAVAITLTTSWIVVTGVHVTVLGWLTRSTTMLLLGDLLGVTVDRFRASERRLAEAQALARLAWWDWDAAEPGRVTTSAATSLDAAELEVVVRVACEAVAARTDPDGDVGPLCRFEYDVPVAALARWLHIRGEVVAPGRVHGTVQDVTELRAIADVRHDLGIAVSRHRDAVEIHDSVVQALAAAKWSIESGNLERGLDALDDALSTAQQLVADLLGDDVQPADDLLRSEPRSAWSVSRPS